MAKVEIDPEYQKQIAEYERETREGLPRAVENDQEKLRSKRHRLERNESREQKESLEHLRGQLAPKEISKRDNDLRGSFSDAKLDSFGQIELESSEKKEVAKSVKKIKKQFKFSLPSLLRGAQTATEYDSRARNFSTRTTIINLEGDKKIFAVYNYPLSWIHRWLDGFSKRMAGDRMAKASSRN